MTIKNLTASFIMEATGLVTLLRFGNVESLFIYLLLHAVASLLISILIKLFLRKGSNRGAVRVFTLLIFLSGPAGFILSILAYVALSLRKIELTPLYESVSHEIVPEVEFEGRKVGEAFGQIKSPNIVVYMSRAQHPLAVRYLKEAVSSPEDEVRLVAFGTLTAMEKDLMEKVGTLKSALEEAKDKREIFSIHSSLAELYWELVYLGISDKELEGFYMDEARKHAMEALKLNESARIHFLLGRIYLRTRSVDRAQEHLLKAWKLGFPKERLLTYLLEVYYLKRDFKSLFVLTENVKGALPPDPKSASILRIWI